MPSQRTSETASVLLDLDADEMKRIDVLADMLDITDERPEDGGDSAREAD